MNARPFLSDLLWPLSLLYGAGVDARVRMYRKGWLKQKRLKDAVISIGNLRVGAPCKRSGMMTNARPVAARLRTTRPPPLSLPALVRTIGLSSGMIVTCL